MINDMRWLISESAERIFRAHCGKDTIDAAEQGSWPSKLWYDLEDAGLTLVAVPSEQGGAGGALGDALAVLRQAGRFAAPLPLAETFLAGWLLAGCSSNVPEGPLTVAPIDLGEPIRGRRRGGALELGGSAKGIPFAAESTRIATLVDVDGQLKLALVPASECHIDPGRNLAGESRDTVTYDGATVSDEVVVSPADGISVQSLYRLGALTRVAMMAGALDTILALTIQHANDRMQFGRPIGKFQAVRQQISVLGAETAAAGRAADEAVMAVDQGDASLEIAIAKARVSEAAGVCNEIAHQLHGAIGFTYEHALHQFTRRLWSWRDEFGGEAYWTAQLGRTLIQQGSANPWEFITGVAGS